MRNKGTRTAHRHSSSSAGGELPLPDQSRIKGKEKEVKAVLKIDNAVQGAGVYTLYIREVGTRRLFATYL